MAMFPCTNHLPSGAPWENSRSTNLSLPAAEQAGRESFWLNQHIFLGTHEDMENIVEAAKKIQTAWS